MFLGAVRDVQRAVYETAVEKGWHDRERSIGEVIALMHSELSEALEGARKRDPASEKIPAYSQVEEEWADVVIRIMDEAEHRGFRVWEAVLEKMRYNEGRERKHGGKAF